MGQEKTTDSTSQPKMTIFQASQMTEFSPDNHIFNEWKERLEIHFTDIGVETETSKKATLLKSIGTNAYSLLRAFCDPQKPNDKTYDELCKLLENHYMPPVIIFRERQIFYTASKNYDESVSQWYARVKTLALKCKFNDLEEAVRDRFIMGMANEEKLFEKFCEDDEKITVSKALSKALIYEVKLKDKARSTDVNFIRNKGNNNAPRGHQSNGKKHEACKHCGWKSHKSTMCKFKDAICNNCGRKGHLKPVCHAKEKNLSTNFVNLTSISHIQKTNTDISTFVNTGTRVGPMDGGGIDRYSIFNISGQPKSDTFNLAVCIDGIRFDAECDTGSPTSLMPLSHFSKHFDPHVLKTTVDGYDDYGGHPIKIIGEFLPSIMYRDQTQNINMIVTDVNRPILLGRNFLRAFGFMLQQVNSITENNSENAISKLKSEFSDVFKVGLGTFKGPKVHLEVLPGTKPIFCKPRPVPLAWKPIIEKKFNEFCDSKMMEPVDNADWASPIVPIVKPGGDLRICGDYKVTINKFLLDFKYPLPRIEEIFASLRGGQLFSKLDLSNAYNQLELDDESQNLCTLSTHLGLFRVKRLPFGVKVAGAIFQKTIETLLRGIPNVMNFMDDIVVTGPDFESHLRTLEMVLKKLQSVGLRLNIEKSCFFMESISYLGFTIDKDGLRMNKKNVESVLNAPVPTNISEVRSLIGMVNFYSIFMPGFAEKMEPLYSLLRKDVKFHWNSEANKAFELLKQEITSDRVLVHFDPNKPVILTTDACDTAVAGILSHEFPNGDLRPIAFVSRSLTKAERNYSTIQKEALAIVFSVTKLYQYLTGLPFILQTDHKPLISIFGEHKGIPLMAAARMQRWAFILSGFNFKIKHIKGSLNHADALSRIPQQKIDENCSADFMHENFIETSHANYINFIDDNNALQLSFKNIQIETRRDKVLSKLIEAVQKGTVADLKGDEFVPYKAKSDELSVESGCLLWGYRSIVPIKLRRQILLDLHKSHLGIVKTKALARSFIWWPKIDKDIENLVKSCHPCQLHQASPEKSPLIPWQPADHPWSRIHIDYAGPVHGYYLLVIIDSFSKWLEVFKSKTMTASYTIGKLRETFCRYGLPDTLVSDNGTQFKCPAFENFMKMNHIVHIATAPGKPATNGQAENSVKTVKKSVTTTLEEANPGDFDLILNRFLFDYRITAHSTTKVSPAEIMFGRQLKSRFSLLKPPLVKDKILCSQEKNIQNHRGNRNVQFDVGQKVYIRDYTNPNKPSWTPAKIKEVLGSRHYGCVIAQSGREIKRHTEQIREATDRNDLLEVSEPDTNNESRSEHEHTDLRIDSPDTSRAHAAQLNEEEIVDLTNSLNQTETSEYSPSDTSAEYDDTVIETTITPAIPLTPRPTRDCAKKAKENITAQCRDNLV